MRIAIGNIYESDINSLLSDNPQELILNVLDAGKVNEANCGLISNGGWKTVGALTTTIRIPLVQILSVDK